MLNVRNEEKRGCSLFHVPFFGFNDKKDMAYKIKQGDILHRVFILDLGERNLHILKEVWKVDKVEGGELFISKEFPDNRRKVRNTIREEYMSKLGYSVTKKGAATICVKETERLVAKYLTAIKKLKDEGKKK